MYIDYGHRNKRSSPGRKILGAVVLVLLAGCIGVGVFWGTDYYMKVVKEQESAEEILPTPISVAENMTSAPDSAEAQTGIYGLWTAAGEETEEDTAGSIYDNLDGEKWMPDFVDNRNRIVSKGIYLSAQEFYRKLDSSIEMIGRTELNTIVVDVKTDDGIIIYDMDCPLAKEINAIRLNVRDIKAFVDRLHDEGIYVIARVVSMKDPVMGRSRPDLCMTMKDGSIYKDNKGSTWLNPYKDEVWDYLINIAKCCADAGFDEVNMDYIRFSTDRGYLDIDFGPEAETKSKTEVITAGIKKLCEEIKPLGVFVSCDLFGSVISSSVDAKLVGQSYFQMAQYLDYLCPMIYPSHYIDGAYRIDYPDCHPYDLIFAALMDSKKVLYMIDDTGNKAEVRPWLQDFTASWVKHHITYGPKEVRDQIQAVYDTGYSGWLLWNASVNYTEGALNKAD